MNLHSFQNRRKSPGRGCLVFGLACLSLAGCGANNSDLAEVSGTVTFKGKPVTEGTVMFVSEGGELAAASIGEGGNYQLKSSGEDGVRAGNYVVTVTAFETIGKGGTPAADGGIGPGGVPQMKWLVPQLYSDRATTPLRRDVAAGANEINLDLPEKS